MSNQRRGPMGGHGHMGAGEKAKDFKGTLKRVLKYIGPYKIPILFVMLFAIGSTIFNIIGPKVLGKATTEIFTGLVSKVTGGEGIDFGKIGRILVTLLCLYVISALFSFIQHILQLVPQGHAPFIGFKGGLQAQPAAFQLIHHLAQKRHALFEGFNFSLFPGCHPAFPPFASAKVPLHPPGLRAYAG